ncbi:Asp-tRNA(Asn)/Glu-tRNA(Gln) amidotransferase subunit GatC [Candidatus Uhrbacteria bacterium]|nr:Asp-tRNA(Asn)/Glu-tRNA(Gln) amidotransferase subunit GatC [Candidatus Uhrbacteria bacterium]
MKLSLEQIRHIAALSRLELVPEEEDQFRERVSAVIEYVGQLSECQTDGVEPMAQAIASENAWRSDESVPVGEEIVRRLVESFPEREGDLLKVRAVFS